MPSDLHLFVKSKINFWWLSNFGNNESEEVPMKVVEIWFYPQGKLLILDRVA